MNELSIPTSQSGEIILYQPDENVRLEVRIEEDTVWLSQQQMTILFQTTKQNVSLHINNIFKEGELRKEATVKDYLTVQSEGERKVNRIVSFYNLDVIISVGYRVKSQRGTRFRQWANGVLKDYLLKGYSINDKLIQMEDRIDRRLMQHEKQLQEQQQQIDFFIRTNQPPIEGVFFEGQIFDAYRFVEELIKTARQDIVLVDNYIDASVIDVLGHREAGVKAEIYTETVSVAISHAAALYNAQHPDMKVEVRACASRFHDRFLIIDDDVYHLGASVKDLGKRLFAFSRLGLDKSIILQQLGAI